MTASQQSETWILPKDRLEDLIRLLSQEGFEVIGPRIEQQAIVYGPIQSAKDLPIGWTDRQAPGSYRLEKRPDDAYFGYAVGPHSWKKYLFPPALQLWQARRTGDSFEIQETKQDPPRRALLGVRSCELHAIAVQDRVFLDRAGQFTDPYYARARERMFLIAVECEHPAGTCFCTSMGTGPHVRDRPANIGPAFCDLALTELDDAFVVRADSLPGRDLLNRLGLATAAAEQVEDANRRVAAAAKAMGRSLDVTDIRNLLHRNQEHPRWDNVADRCLSCTNCTLVCPTCFCSSVEDVTDLSLENAERVRRWDSCFNPEFAQVHGGNFRPSIRGRYRQWLTHKFASWFDQFDISGCVGCGRCITWCPVGIDVTEEITAIRKTDGQREGIAS
ncbi:MAG TPA: 4Fe-4S dicluster domain-containing protein [Gemmataceae bacterium]|nr:4Fe-4S dicluster domain-containing protein [Gemmataceae bacterium]